MVKELHSRQVMCVVVIDPTVVFIHSQGSVVVSTIVPPVVVPWVSFLEVGIHWHVFPSTQLLAIQSKSCPTGHENSCIIKFLHWKYLVQSYGFGTFLPRLVQ